MQMIVRVPRRRFGFVEPVESQINRLRDSRCALAPNHDPTNSHKFPTEFLLTPSRQGLGRHWHGTRAGSDPNELISPEKTEQKSNLFSDAPAPTLDAGPRYAAASLESGESGPV
jgi:hypothetical protein